MNLPANHTTREDTPRGHIYMTLKKDHQVDNCYPPSMSPFMASCMVSTDIDWYSNIYKVSCRAFSLRRDAGWDIFWAQYVVVFWYSVYPFWSWIASSTIDDYLFLTSRFTALYYCLSVSWKTSCRLGLTHFCLFLFLIITISKILFPLACYIR